MSETASHLSEATNQKIESIAFSRYAESGSDVIHNALAALIDAQTSVAIHEKGELTDYSLDDDLDSAIRREKTTRAQVDALLTLPHTQALLQAWKNFTDDGMDAQQIAAKLDDPNSSISRDRLRGNLQMLYKTVQDSDVPTEYKDIFRPKQGNTVSSEELAEALQALSQLQHMSEAYDTSSYVLPITEEDIPGAKSDQRGGQEETTRTKSGASVPPISEADIEVWQRTPKVATFEDLDDKQTPKPENPWAYTPPIATLEDQPQVVEKHPKPESNDDQFADREYPEEAALELARVTSAKRDAFVAKALGPAFGRSRDALAQKFEDANNEYLGKLREYFAFMMDNTSDMETSEQAAEYLEKLVNLESEDEDTLQHAMMIEQGGTRAKLMAKFAGLSKKGKILVSAGAGLALAGGGAALGLAAGAVGFGAGIGLAGASISRFTRGYLTTLSSIYARKETPKFKISDEMKAGKSAHNGHFRDMAAEHIGAISWARLNETEKTRKRAVIGGMGAVALGGAFGTAIAVADHTDFGHAGLGHAYDWIHDKFSDLPSIGEGDAANHDTIAAHNAHNAHEQHMMHLDHEAHTNHQLHMEHAGRTPTLDTLPARAHIAHPGEGWGSQLRQMGFSKSEVPGILDKLKHVTDPELKKAIYIQNGEPRIALRANTRFSDRMLQSILDLRNK